MTINQNIQLSSIILIYEIIFLALYYIFNINKNFLSWPILINIFIIFVVIFCNCNLSFYTILSVLSIKIIFLIWLLTIVDFSLKNYFISLSFLLIYYLTSNINTVYNCNIQIYCLINSILVSSIIYLYNIPFISLKT